LNGPIDQDIGWYLASQDAIKAAAPGVLHYQTQLGVQANASQGGYILVLEGPEEFGLLQDIFPHPLHIILARLMGNLYGHLLAIVVAAMDLAEATGTDDLLDFHLIVLDLMRLDVANGGGDIHLQWVLVGDKVLGEDANL